jgi:hypothetical protein
MKRIYRGHSRICRVYDCQKVLAGQREGFIDEQLTVQKILHLHSPVYKRQGVNEACLLVFVTRANRLIRALMTEACRCFTRPP